MFASDLVFSTGCLEFIWPTPATSPSYKKQVQKSSISAQARLTNDPEFHTKCLTVRKHYQDLDTKEEFGRIYQYLLDIAFARMSKLDETKRVPPLHAADGALSTSAVDAFQNQIAKLTTWQSRGPQYALPPEPHRVVFWCCTWGTNLCYLVWQFCTKLSWPDPSAPSLPDDPGISSTELAISFMLWLNRMLPVRLKDGSQNVTLDYDDQKVQLLPLKLRSLRVLAERFRWIVKHINTFSRSNIVPSYKKQGTSSLTRLRFTNYHEGGISRRPTLNADPIGRMDTYTRCLSPCLMTRHSIQRSLHHHYLRSFPHPSGLHSQRCRLLSRTPLSNMFVMPCFGKSTSIR